MKMSTKKFWNLIQFVLLSASLVWWMAGLVGIVHWSYNFQVDPYFLSLSQIKKSFLVILILYVASSVSVGIIVENWTHRSLTAPVQAAVLTFLFMLLLGTTIWALPSSPDCGEAVRRMQDSGVAYDARERGIFGKDKIDEPSGDRFSPDSKQLAWWGKFNRPFEYWGNPDLRADWFDPEGQMIASIDVVAERCKLAVARVKKESFQPGMWRVDVSCEDGTVVDRKQFAVGRSPAIPADVQVINLQGAGEDRKITVN